MADRSAARAFGAVFKILASSPFRPNKILAGKIALVAKEGDFSLYQMDCDNALVKLGLARMATMQEKIDDYIDVDHEHYIYLF